MINVIMLYVIMPNVIMPNVVAPFPLTSSDFDVPADDSAEAISSPAVVGGQVDVVSKIFSTAKKHLALLHIWHCNF